MGQGQRPRVAALAEALRIGRRAPILELDTCLKSSINVYICTVSTIFVEAEAKEREAITSPLTSFLTS